MHVAAPCVKKSTLVPPPHWYVALVLSKMAKVTFPDGGPTPVTVALNCTD